MGVHTTLVPRASAVVPGAADGEPIAMHADHIQGRMIAMLTAVPTAVLTAAETAMRLTMVPPAGFALLSSSTMKDSQKEFLIPPLLFWPQIPLKSSRKPNS
jgi:hypothetical protein